MWLLVYPSLVLSGRLRLERNIHSLNIIYNIGFPESKRSVWMNRDQVFGLGVPMIFIISPVSCIVKHVKMLYF